MLKVVGVIALVFIALLSFYGYKIFFKPIAPVPAIAIELAAHFKQQGILVEPRSIRHGFPDLEAAISYEFKDYPLPISVDVWKNFASASSHLQTTKISPNLNFPTQNGRLVMYLIFWEESEFTTKVLNAFKSFKPSI